MTSPMRSTPSVGLQSAPAQSQQAVQAGPDATPLAISPNAPDTPSQRSGAARNGARRARRRASQDTDALRSPDAPKTTETVNLPDAPDTKVPDDTATPTDRTDLADLTDAEELTELLGGDEELRKATAATQVRIIRQRLGLAEPPTPKTVHLPLASLVVTDEPDLHPHGKSFAVSLGLVGMLHPPAVVAIPGTDTFHVEFGRRRVLGARAMESPPETIECHLYEQLSDTQRALMVLHENGRRAPAWITESAALAELVDAHVGLTDVEIAVALGIPLSTARQRLKIAMLPAATRAQILQGGIPQTIVRRILRLNTTARATLEAQAEEGEQITAELVNQALHGQIGAGLGVVRQALAASWQPADAAATWQEAQEARQHQTQADQRADSIHQDARSSADASADAPDPWTPKALDDLLRMLQSLGHRLGGMSGAVRASLLAQALVQELTVLQRLRA